MAYSIKNIKKGKGLFSKMNISILENKITLYIIFILAIVQVFMMLYKNEFYYASIFLLVGILTSFFTKNMIIILLIAMCFTSVVKYGPENRIEGLTNSSDEEKEGYDGEPETKDGESETKDGKTETKDGEPETKDGKDGEPEKKASKDGKTETKDKPSRIGTLDSGKVKSSAIDLNPSKDKDKESFSQDKVVYTSDEDRELAKTEKMILAQEKMLERMNKYKPLLDTINGIARNVSGFSKMSTDLNE